MAIATAAWHRATLTSFFLPINDVKELFAVNTILEAITEQFGGYTRSSMEKDSKLKGRYKSEELERPIDDWVVQVSVIARGSDIEKQLSELHVRIHKEYALQESPQLAVWILTQDIALLADGLD